MNAPELMTLYVKKIRSVATKTRAMVQNGKIRIEFEIYQHSLQMKLENEQEKPSRFNFSSFIPNNEKCVIDHLNTRFDLVMTGNMCDRIGLSETLNQSNKFLKFPSENPMAYILTHHRTCQLQNTQNNNNVVIASQFLPKNRKRYLSYEGSYELVPDIERNETTNNFASDLFRMKDCLLTNVRWTWSHDSSSRQFNDKVCDYLTDENKLSHVLNHTTEKENRNRDIYEAYRSLNRIIKLEGKCKKIKYPAISSDAIEHSTNNNRFIEQKPESPSGINQNFFTPQNQADFDGMHTTSHKMKNSLRFCVRFGPFHLEYCILRFRI